MEAFALLCDFAEVINGKLYIMGGAWTQVTKVTPLTFTLAAKIDVPYDRTNERLLVEARLVDPDGHIVRVGGMDVQMMATFEVGRPAGIKHGTPMPVPLAWKFVGLDLDFGSYEFRISVENETIATASFDVIRPPQSPGLPTPGSLL